jgi:RNA polymerase sigma factor (sigma-70 family)
MTDDDEIVEAWRSLAARSRGRRDPEAEDHVQDAVVAALAERRRTGRTPEAARGWLRTVARRREADGVRRAQCERRVLASAVFAEPEADDLAGEVLDRYEARWLAGHVDRLPATTRAVVHALAEGGTQAEVADRLGLTSRAVEAHVRRARQALRRVWERAGAVTGLLAGHRWWRRWWRRAGGVSAAGVAAAVGISVIVAPPDNHRLLPLPRPELPSESPRPDDRVPRPVRGAGAAVRGPGPASYAVAPAPVTRAVGPTASPAPPTPTPSPTEEPTPPGTGAPAQFVVVPSGGGDNKTVLPTEAGASYEVVVTGTYSYDSRATGLADCGHLFQPGSPTWSAYQSLLVDGAPAPCWAMPPDDLHTYTWTFRGTGREMVFAIQDHGGGDDNRGGLLVTVRQV